MIAPPAKLVFTESPVLSTKNFNNWFNGNTTNFNFGSKSPDPKLFNNWFSGNTTNFGPSCKSYPLKNFYYRPV